MLVNMELPSKSYVGKTLSCIEGTSLRTLVSYHLLREGGCSWSKISSLRDFVFHMKQ